LPEASEERALERTSVARVGVRVRVLHADDAAPLEGFDVELVAGDAKLGEATTDRSGEVNFRAPQVELARARITPPWGWIVDPRWRLVEMPEGATSTTLEFRAREAGQSPLRARLVDDATGEPVPYYLVHVLTSDGQRESLESDAEGRLISQRNYLEQTLTLVFRDALDPDPVATRAQAGFQREFDHRVIAGGAADVEVAISVGPTYRLTILAPESVLAGQIDAALHPASSKTYAASQVRQTHVRRQGGLWVRFPHDYGFMVTFLERPELVLASHDGKWFGTAPVPRSNGTFDVDLAMEARGVVMARIVDGSDQPIANAQVTLDSSATSGWTRQSTSQLCSSNGLVEFPLLAPGAYTLSAIAPAHDRRQIGVRVDPVERTDVELVLPPAALDGTLSGVVLCDRHYVEPVRFWLTSLRPAGRSFQFEVELAADGERGRAEFEFANLPRGDYRLTAHIPRRVTLSPAALEVSTGTRDIVLRTPEVVDAEMLEFLCLARDAADGRPLAECSVVLGALGVAGGFFGFTPRTFPFAVARADVSTSEAWAGSPGYRWSRLDLSSARPDGEASTVEVRLQRGWSASLLALGPGFTPLAGARVLADGVLIAETDADGRAALALDVAPQRLGVEHRGWSLEPSSRGALAQLCNGAPFARVFFTP
jgi:hypothetical protein